MFVKHYSVVVLAFFVVFCISCAPKTTDLSKALVTANSIYDDLHPQVEAALVSESLTKERKQSLLKIQSDLNDYTVAYNELQKSLAIWQETNTPPENTRRYYDDMKESLSKAVTTAYTVNIYINECSGRTTLKGKTGNCH